MTKKDFNFSYEIYKNDKDVEANLQPLIKAARQAVDDAYAPYSHFHVSASILLANGKIITGFNFENASYPVGICAERTALSSAITQFPSEKIIAIAVSYNPEKGKSNQPIFPCGLCRQFMLECEVRNKKTITLLMTGLTGKIIKVNSVKDLLPFSFDEEALKS